MGKRLRQPRPRLERIDRVMRRLMTCYEINRFKKEHGPDPFRILVGCLISLRTKDEVTFPATERLFKRARRPSEMRKLREASIAKLIYPAGFYRQKAMQIRQIARIIDSEYGGRVPDDIDTLLEFPGVGRKTANLVITLGFDKPGICVDTHVHRISNRLRWVRTREPNETETMLRKLLPPRYWIPINETLVRHGQQVCKPISPICSECPVAGDCPRVAVTRSR